MILIFTLDNQNGVNLAGKRQSKDRAVADRILSLAAGQLYIKSYTAKFFKNTSVEPCYTIIENYSMVPSNAICFAEEVLPMEMLDAADKIYVFRWNRDYPSLAQDRLNLDGFNVEVIDEFPGNSHEKITLEVYTK